MIRPRLISMHFINNAYWKIFIFHSNLSFKTSVLHQFPTFYADILPSWKKTFLISVTLLIVQDPNFYRLTIILQLITISFTLKNFQVTKLTLSISYLHPKENLKTGITSKGNFNSSIITNLWKVYTQFLKSGNK